MVLFYNIFLLLNMNDIRDYQIKTFKSYDFILKQRNLFTLVNAGFIERRTHIGLGLRPHTIYFFLVDKSKHWPDQTAKIV